jgi:dolichyl-phosphate-mannose-protein mannosyltransferase
MLFAADPPSHYFPALYFAIIAVCQLCDFMFYRFGTLGLPQRPIIGRSAVAIYIALTIVAFSIYAPLVYGNMWTQNECKRVKVLSTWDWDCSNFFTSVRSRIV